MKSIWHQRYRTGRTPLKARVKSRYCLAVKRASFLQQRVVSHVVYPGRWSGLESGKDYLLELSYPDDVSEYVCHQSRSGNHARITPVQHSEMRSVVIPTRIQSLYPSQSGTDAVWRQFFTLHDRYPGAEDLGRTLSPNDGIDVVIVSLSTSKPAVSRFGRPKFAAVRSDRRCNTSSRHAAQ